MFAITSCRTMHSFFILFLIRSYFLWIKWYLGSSNLFYDWNNIALCLMYDKFTVTIGVKEDLATVPAHFIHEVVSINFNTSGIFLW